MVDQKINILPLIEINNTILNVLNVGLCPLFGWKYTGCNLSVDFNLREKFVLTFYEKKLI